MVGVGLIEFCRACASQEATGKMNLRNLYVIKVLSGCRSTWRKLICSIKIVKLLRYGSGVGPNVYLFWSYCNLTLWVGLAGGNLVCMIGGELGDRSRCLWIRALPKRAYRQTTTEILQILAKCQASMRYK